MSSTTNPFKGGVASIPAPMRVLHRFTKPGGRVAEIRERTITQFKAIEFLVFVEGSLLESQIFHNGREVEYPASDTVWRAPSWLASLLLGSCDLPPAQVPSVWI